MDLTILRTLSRGAVFFHGHGVVLYCDVHFVLDPHGSILKVCDIYLFTARCYTEHRYATVRCPSVCLSVSLFVPFMYVLHTGWNTSKIISRPNNFRYLLTLTQHQRSGPTGINLPPKLGWNWGGVRSKKPAISLKRCKIGPRLL